jgi:hypothetical protein
MRGLILRSVIPISGTITVTGRRSSPVNVLHAVFEPAVLFIKELWVFERRIIIWLQKDCNVSKCPFIWQYAANFIGHRMAESS